MGKVFYLREAREDLFAIWLNLKQISGSTDVADRIIDSIDDDAKIYAANPAVGESRPAQGKGVRCLLVNQYVVFYLSLVDGIEIVQIIHGARDIPARFRNLTP